MVLDSSITHWSQSQLIPPQSCLGKLLSCICTLWDLSCPRHIKDLRPSLSCFSWEAGSGKLVRMTTKTVRFKTCGTEASGLPDVGVGSKEVLHEVWGKITKVSTTFGLLEVWKRPGHFEKRVPEAAEVRPRTVGTCSIKAKQVPVDYKSVTAIKVLTRTAWTPNVRKTMAQNL